MNAPFPQSTLALAFSDGTEGAAHFEAGPSRLPVVIHCPATVVMSRGVEQGDMSAAERGTRLHKLLELCLKARKRTDYFPHDGEWSEYTQDERDAVDQVVDYVHDFVIEYGGDLQVEIDVDPRKFYPGMFGRVDVVIIANGTLIVIDAKFGRVSVPATTPQLKAYAVGLLSALDFLDFSEVRLAIAQPFAQNFDETVTTPAELNAWAADVMVPALEDAFSPNPTICAGDHCRHCNARAVCGVRKAAHYDNVAALLDQDLDTNRLSIGELAGVLATAENCKKFLDDVTEYATREALAGRPIPGTKVVEGRSVRKWADPAATMLTLSESLLARFPELSPAEAVAKVTKVEPITITAAEKLLGKAGIPPGLTVKPQGKATLAPESDPRPVFAPAAGISDALDSVEF